MLVLIPAVQRGAYEDLQLLVMSLRLYAPDVVVHVAYKGEVPPPRLFGVARIVQQPVAARHFGDACRFLLEDAALLDSTPAQEHYVFLNDDTVVTPETFPTLKEDLGIIGGLAGDKVGLVGLRSNMVAGVQNVRWPATAESKRDGLRWESERQILEVPRVFGVGFYVKRTVIEDVSRDWTALHWFSDNLLSHDLLAKGYRHFVSRAYLHHHGSRSGRDYETYDREGREWLRLNRPDFPLP